MLSALGGLRVLWLGGNGACNEGSGARIVCGARQRSSGSGSGSGSNTNSLCLHPPRHYEAATADAPVKAKTKSIWDPRHQAAGGMDALGEQLRQKWWWTSSRSKRQAQGGPFPAHLPAPPASHAPQKALEEIHASASGGLRRPRCQ